MNEFLEVCTSWPALPFSILMGCVGLYWLLLVLGTIDLDMFDLDLDIDTDIDVNSSFFDWGLVGIKWFNLGDVPLMFWLSIVALTAWSITVHYDGPMPNATRSELAVVMIRNFGLGLLAAKLLTQPLKGKFKSKPPNTVREMIGRTCVVITSEVTPKHGNALCHVSDGAPLQLNVRTVEGAIPKSALVEIVDFSPDTGVYFVQDTGQRQA